MVARCGGCFSPAFSGLPAPPFFGLDSEQSFTYNRAMVGNAKEDTLRTRVRDISRFYNEKGRMPSGKWFVRQATHLSKRQRVFEERIKKMQVYGNKRGGRMLPLNALQELAWHEMYEKKREPEKGIIEHAESVSTEEIKEIKKALSDIEKLKKTALKAGRELPDFGPSQRMLNEELDYSKKFMAALAEWKKTNKTR